MGSSAASAAAAAWAVNGLFGSPLTKSELIPAGLASEAAVSGYHADNVGPSLLGGFVLIRWAAPPCLRCGSVAVLGGGTLALPGCGCSVASFSSCGLRPRVRGVAAGWLHSHHVGCAPMSGVWLAGSGDGNTLGLWGVMEGGQSTSLRQHRSRHGLRTANRFVLRVSPPCAPRDHNAASSPRSHGHVPAV
jgi:hypothetical protein